MADNLWYGDKRGIVLEGGSRSGKSWAVIDYIIQVCAQNKLKGIVVNIVKETYAGFKTTLYDDFNKRFGGLKIDNPFAVSKDVSSFYLFGNKIQFMGADQAAKFHGASCDYFWINEATDIHQSIFDQLEMRCRVAWILDYNPKITEHWIFTKLEKRPDVLFYHSTMLDNPYIGHWEKKKILSYEPTSENITNGTADDYMWKVYGLGQRSSPQGLVFNNITWIYSFPENIEQVVYGMDFGYTNSPTAIAKVGRDGRNLYIQKLFYHPTENAVDLSKAIEVLNIQDAIWADSADPGMIADLRIKNIQCYPTIKFPGSIKYGIDLMKQYKIHLVRDPDMRKEAENYKWREINGLRLNEPVDDFNHIWDAARYACLSNYRQ